MANSSLDEKYGHLRRGANPTGSGESTAAKFGAAMFGAAGGSLKIGSKDDGKDRAKEKKAEAKEIWEYQEVQHLAPQCDCQVIPWR